MYVEQKLCLPLPSINVCFIYIYIHCSVLIYIYKTYINTGQKLKIALFGELSLEEAIDLSRDRQIID
jgi:hypothetical protein